jgi:ribonuclease-3
LPRRKTQVNLQFSLLMSTPDTNALHTILDSEVPTELLRLALTHPSAVGEGLERTLQSNQRLEFLGDAVLGAAVAAHLYEAQSVLPEGELTLRKIALVQKSTLARAARRLGLGEHVILGRGEETAGGRNRDAILADALEALIGALFLAHGFEVAQKFALRALCAEIEALGNKDTIASAKNLLQEFTQANGLGTPTYRTTQSSGPAHARRFQAEVLLLQTVSGTGEGATKKEAESKAAALALEQLQSDVPFVGKNANV